MQLMQPLVLARCRRRRRSSSRFLRLNPTSQHLVSVRGQGLRLFVSRRMRIGETVFRVATHRRLTLCESLQNRQERWDLGRSRARSPLTRLRVDEGFPDFKSCLTSA